jgi:YegS/Rv2252/BmrU family lipid kinase
MLKSLGLRFEHDLTEAPGHAVELAREAARKGCRRVVSVGGDGTINEVVNGLYASGSIEEVELGIISTGTGGDYIRTIGLPRSYAEMCRCLMNPRRLKVDLGMVEYMNGSAPVQRLFVNFAGLGFDAEIVRRTTQQFKSLGGLASYLMGLLATLVCYRNREVSLVIDGEAVENEVCTVIMNNGRYGGGGMLTAPGADLADGWLDVLVIGDLSKADLLWSLPRIYKGTHLTHPKVNMRQAKEIEIRSAQPTHLQADGELLGELPARFRILPSALNIVV